MQPQTKERLTLAAAVAALALVLAAGSWVATFRPWATEETEASGVAAGIRAIGVDKPFEVELGELRRMACGLVNATGRPLTQPASAARHSAAARARRACPDACNHQKRPRRTEPKAPAPKP